MVVSDELLDLVYQILGALTLGVVLDLVGGKPVRQQLLHALLSLRLVLHQLIEPCVDVSEPAVHLVLLLNQRVIFTLLQRDRLS